MHAQAIFGPVSVLAIWTLLILYMVASRRVRGALGLLSVALVTGLVSIYSSTTGVVLPAFLPMVKDLAASQPGSEGRSALGKALALGLYVPRLFPQLNPDRRPLHIQWFRLSVLH